MNDFANVKKEYRDAVIGRSVTTKGVVTDHDEEITKAGADQLWDYIHGANLEIVRKK